MNESMPRALALGLAFALAACGGDAAPTSDLTGAVAIDGSSTVFPVSEAMAEEFQALNRGVRVTVGFSGTGGGFKRFCAGELDISDASRPIKDSEAAICAENGVEYVEVPVAWDGLSVMVNPQNDFVDCLTVEDLKRIWEPGSQVRTWRDVRPEWPDEEIALYGPGVDSGTFDYFTEEIVGETDASRGDYQASEDDNILVQGIAGDRYALGYFGYAYYVENTDKLKLVAVDGGEGCVAPSKETIESGTYKPLSRPLLIYVSRRAIERPEVAAFVEFYLTHAPELVPSTGYVALSPEEYGAKLEELGLGGA
ncbi:MAG: PstS family phosphate ABC transporter substrate-binding protein [Gemmatimonadetes bacterium]|nr:MAG: PstS family phosphate ABC transporter substrate-binding protein [Gemmatimonadota bacterium]